MVPARLVTLASQRSMGAPDYICMVSTISLPARFSSTALGLLEAALLNYPCQRFLKSRSHPAFQLRQLFRLISVAASMGRQHSTHFGSSALQHFQLRIRG